MSVAKLADKCAKLRADELGKPRLKAVVVESDWPEYNTVWRMIENRVDGADQIEAAGICGSDMHAYHGHDERRVPPMILGHELAGTVIDGELTGTRVAINPMLTCNHCRECLQGNPNRCQQRDLVGLGRAGGYADKIAIEPANLFPLTDDLSATHASLMEPHCGFFACGCNGRKNAHTAYL